MGPDERLDPDRLLQQVQQDEARARRGRLKIFFGASAGVGKTYAMLTAARAAQAQGAAIVVGVVETHGRAETEAMARDLPRLPLKAVPYRDRMLQEFDLDAALAWTKTHPEPLLLLDELAHSNAPRFASSQALAGRGGTARRRHRRLVDDERAAPGEPERHRWRHHRHPRVGDRARPALRRGRRGRGGRPAARRAAGAAEGRQGLPARSRPSGRQRTSSARATCWRCANWRCAAPPTASTTRCRLTGGAVPCRRSGPTARRCWPASVPATAARRWCAPARAWPRSSTCPGMPCLSRPRPCTVCHRPAANRRCVC